MLKNRSYKFYSSIILFIMCALISGCEIGYYTHLAQGQWSLLSKRQPISAVISDSATPLPIVKRLELTQITLEFAKHSLKLELTGQYSQYVALERPYVIWSLAAAPELSLQPYQWCYPLIGCANYRGYFDVARAHQEQSKLQEQGYETYLRGVSAYSTLGWFADPLLSSFDRYSNDDFVELLFHELAHSKMYIKNDTEYNESFASFVGQQGLKEFKEQGLMPPSDKPNTSKSDYEKLQSLVLTYKQELEMLYTSDTSDGQKRIEKNRLFEALQQRYQDDQQNWQRPHAFDYWMTSINNAKLATYGDYENKIPFFAALYKNCEQDWDCFYKASEHHGKNISKSK